MNYFRAKKNEFFIFDNCILVEIKSKNNVYFFYFFCSVRAQCQRTQTDSRVFRNSFRFYIGIWMKSLEAGFALYHASSKMRVRLILTHNRRAHVQCTRSTKHARIIEWIETFVIWRKASRKILHSWNFSSPITKGKRTIRRAKMRIDRDKNN